MTDLVRSLSLDYERLEERALLSLKLRLGIKRTIDIAFAAIGLLLTLPVFLLVIIGVRLGSPGPAFFRQKRIGVGGRRFEIVKFRTMVVDAEEILASDPELKHKFLSNNFKLAVDPRVTRFGRFLRVTSLDELPQLWNVLRGDMSLVGPRPLIKEYFDVFGEYQKTYIMMRPGITGYWQVAGRSAAGHQMAELSDYYVQNWSLWLDLQVMVRTVPAVLARRGAH